MSKALINHAYNEHHHLLFCTPEPVTKQVNWNNEYNIPGKLIRAIKNIAPNFWDIGIDCLPNNIEILIANIATITAYAAYLD